ncbi:hypothetical protein KIW84_051418 [Lathyrus oleraceus]|uniref:Uncharacterized protein n=1 Tax=Pisum sativum TaxID=3888 RepID=A0A9D5ADK8_PEA|nr:hypothetical protein KIW84_051418 [Pisum sativum]
MSTIARFVDDRVKCEKKLKIVTPKPPKKNTEKSKHKSHKEKPMKKRKLEEMVTENKSLKRKLVQTNIMGSRNQNKFIDGNSLPLSKSNNKYVFIELKEVLKALEETIRSSTLRNKNMDMLIKMVAKEEDVEEGEEAGSSESSSEKKILKSSSWSCF